MSMLSIIGAVHGYDRAIAYCITNMQMQGALAIFTVNLKKNTQINVEYVIYTSILPNEPV
jgi:hypothetical protein